MQVLEALDIAFQAIDGGDQCGSAENEVDIEKLIDELVQTPIACQVEPENSSNREEKVVDEMEKCPVMSEEQIQNTVKPTNEPIYEIIDDVLEQNTEPKVKIDSPMKHLEDEEPYYQVPKPVEPYYEVPKSKPIPLYENVEIFMGVNRSNSNNLATPTVQPPKEKPPPPPVEDEATDDEGGNEEYEEDVKPDVSLL